MDEATFWLCLEYRLCGELAGMPSRHHRRFWCDGFLAEDCYLDGPTLRLAGRCWLFNGRQPEKWRFNLLFPGPVESREAINWAALLPPEDVTRWLSFDEQRRYLEIEPSVAVPDADAAKDRLQAGL